MSCDQTPKGQIPSRDTPRWPDSQEDRTKGEQNPKLTEPVVDPILRWQNVMWPDSKVDRIQVDKHAGEQNAKWTYAQMEKVL